MKLFMHSTQCEASALDTLRVYHAIVLVLQSMNPHWRGVKTQRGLSSLWRLLRGKPTIIAEMPWRSEMAQVSHPFFN